MTLPDSLQEKIVTESKSFSKTLLENSAKELTSRYREGQKGGFMTTAAHRMAYMMYRMPATYAVLTQVFAELKERCPFPLTSLLDLGAGPGTALWAGQEHFFKFTCFEQDVELLKLLKRFAPESIELKTQCVNLEAPVELPSHDVVLLSYSLGEMKERLKLLSKAYAAGKVVIIVEPGTPKGFEVIREARTHLIQEGAHIIAPCPHAHVCPMVDGDWCHFSKRLQRSREHKSLKEAQLSYEDEKFSYLIASKQTGITFPSRILRHPIKHTGHVSFTLCTNEGKKENKVLSKKDKDLYRIARKKEWGEIII